MLLTVVMIGGLILSGSVIAGLLMVYQIRQANDIIGSTEAIFAADAGIEVESYCYFKTMGCSDDERELEFSNGASVNSSVRATDDGLTLFITGQGISGRSTRALEVTYFISVPESSPQLPELPETP